MAAIASSPSASRGDRAFYTGMAAALLATALVGFAPTFFLKAIYHPAMPLTPLVQLHGVLFTAWTLLLVGQTTLIAAGRADLHRRTGLVGAALAVAMVPVAVMTALGAARHGLAPPGVDPLVFLVVPLGAIALFALFVAGALWLRRSPQAHKRLMLLATISIITPAIARLPFVHQRPAVALGLTNLFIVAGIAYDLATRRRVHRVYVWGGLLVLLFGPLRVAFGHTDAWHRIASALVN